MIHTLIALALAASIPTLRIDANDPPLGMTSLGNFDLNGRSLTCLGETTDVAADNLWLSGCNAWYGASVNTAGGNLRLRAGEGKSSFTMATFSNCAGDTMTVNVDGTDYQCLEGGGDWARGASNAAACSSLASCVQTKAGAARVLAECASTEIRIKLLEGYSRLTVTTGDATCATVVNATDGKLVLAHELWPLYNGAARFCLDIDGNSCIDGNNTGDQFRIQLGGSTLASSTTTAWTWANNLLVNGPSVTYYSTSGPIYLGSDADFDSSATGITTGGVVVRGEMMMPRIRATSTTGKIAACAANTEGMFATINDTDDAAPTQVCVCISKTGDSTFSYVSIFDGTTDCTLD